MNQTKTIQGPHLRTERTTRNVMLHVSISLIPALLGAVYFFGIRALYLTGLSVAVCVLTEYLWQKLTKKTGDRRRFQRSRHRNAAGI